MTTEPLLSPADLHRLRACDPDRRLADTRAAGWADDQPRRLREWATLPRADSPSLSAPLGDIAWAMMRLDARRWGRTMAGVLEAVLPPDTDPRSLAVIGLLRGEDWSGAAAAAWAAEAAGMAGAAARARPDLDITTIMLDSWEKE